LKTVELEIKDIIIDEQIYPRVQSTWMKAYHYRLAIDTGAKFPPITVGMYKGKKCLVDGLHRIRAFESLGKTKIWATLKRYRSKKAMFIDAVTLNNIHGKQLTVMDKALIFAKLQEFDVSKKDISKLLSTPINKFRVYVERLVTIQGKNVPIKSILDKALRDQIITEEDVAQIVSTKNQNRYVSRTVTNAFEQLIDAITQGAVPWDKPEIIALSTQLVTLLNEHLSLEVTTDGD